MTTIHKFKGSNTAHGNAVIFFIDVFIFVVSIEVNVAGQFLVFRLGIWEVPVSNLGPRTSFPG
jgi:uncharacterized membrane protein YecN with MAPEG domain